MIKFYINKYNFGEAPKVLGLSFGFEKDDENPPYKAVFISILAWWKIYDFGIRYISKRDQ